MRLHADRFEAVTDGTAHVARLDGRGELGVGPLTVVVDDGDGWPAFRWSLANRSDGPVRVRSVALVLGVHDVRPPLRLLRNGYQSWSPTGVATFGVDVDPSTLADFEFLQAVHHADQRTARPGELRSEWVTLLADGSGAVALVGFDGGHDHDGTLRLREATDGGMELWVEAFLGDAVVAPGEQRRLHAVLTADGASPAELLGRWADEVGGRAGARTGAPYQVGWCSWYHYFHDVTEAALRANLALADDWPFDVFQLDDGYQAGIGDWLDTNADFPSGLDRLAADIAAAGRIPGLWLAPFLAAPDSRHLADHPHHVAKHRDGVHPLRAWWNPPWGGGDDGFMHALDTTHPEVLDHLESLARSLVERGFRYLKLDFTFAPSVDGVWHDPGRTPAQRVRAGYEAIRRGAGDDVFILGCGVPLAHVVGLVDGNRIGQDVAPTWSLDASAEVIRGYLGIQPATQFAYGNTAARSFMHRRLWLNDPDCVMLRTSDTELSAAAAGTWARAVGVSGGMALVSDDLALLGGDARALLDEVVDIGRASDAEAIAGRPAVAVDLLDHAIPTRLEAAGYRLDVQVADGTSQLAPPS